MTKSVFDRIDLAADTIPGRPNFQDEMSKAKDEISSIDDELRGVAIKLSTHARIFTPDDLEELSKVLKKLSERLY